MMTIKKQSFDFLLKDSERSLMEIIENYNTMAENHSDLVNKSIEFLNKYEEYTEIQKIYEKQQMEIQEKISMINNKMNWLKETDEKKQQKNEEMKLILEGIKNIIGDAVGDENIVAEEQNTEDVIQNEPVPEKEKVLSLSWDNELEEDDLEENNENNLEEDDLDLENDEDNLEENNLDLETDNLDLEDDEELELKDQKEETVAEINKPDIHWEANANLDLDVDTDATIRADWKIDWNLDVEMETDKSANIKLKSKAEVEWMDDMGEMSVEHTIQPEVKVEINNVEANWIEGSTTGNWDENWINDKKEIKKTKANLKKEDKVKELNNKIDDMSDIDDLALEDLDIDDDLITESENVKNEVKNWLKQNLDKLNF